MGLSSAMTSGIGVYQTLKGAQEQANAKRALENYQRQSLNNVYGNMQVSTRSADLQREEQARLASGEVNALQGAGTRGLIGGLGRVEAGNQIVNEKIGADLNKQENEIAQAQADDQARIRQMMELRQNQDIGALSSQYNAGKNDMNMGMGNVVQGFGSLENKLAQAFTGGAMGNSPTPQLQTSGFTTSANPNGVTNNVNSSYQFPASDRFNPLVNSYNPNIGG